MPRFSANLGFLWADRPLLERIAAAGAAGFRAVELHYPYEFEPAAVADACARANVALLGLNTSMGPRPEDRGLAAVPGREDDARRVIDQAFDFARDAGGTSVHVMAGLVPPAEHAAGRRTLVAALRHAAERSAETGLVTLLEPLNPADMPGYFYGRISEALPVIEEVGSDRVKLMFDCYHVGKVGEDPVALLRAHFDKVGHIQIAAVPSRAEPDEGEIDYRTVFTAIDELGYSGWVGAEYRPRAGTDEGLAWMSRLGVTPGA